MVKLRLRRKGRKKAPTYDIVAVDSRSRRDGDYLERVGYYDPMHKPSTLNFKHDRAIYWLNNGAQPTDIVRSLMSVDGVLLRRQMEFKGKTSEEIEVALAKHKEQATARYLRKQASRLARKNAPPAPVEEAAPAVEEVPVEAVAVESQVEVIETSPVTEEAAPVSAETADSPAAEASAEEAQD
jgi:small subunit ribosomal protein S16